MRGAFGQVHQLARTRFPGIEVHGTPYPLPQWKRPLVTVAQGIQFSALAVCIVGDHIFRQLGIPPPAWYIQNVAPNRFGAAMGVWFVGNLILTNLQNTGAFEVYFDGKLIFSKLAEGRMPTVHELLVPMEAHFAALSRAAGGSAGEIGAGGAPPRAPAVGRYAPAGGAGGAPPAAPDLGDDL
ncbi:hypothetical protein PLESTB_000833700 [Pleodorina starrii]|uniref:Selenoprotein T n=1 Tax=Pleodorina starrii TaxID=330485 RepID=A0A9W6F385_9CHLO|nr:hypothetical protein PLESTM_000149500 [Pleodorina starrii]GLC54195.1 hypothetical protein PLESTB_000833700 [Pleodorina starrii]GLC64502.1 hypothetical protein PLESTF_000173000 [Pleodorina starrii]